MEWILLIVGAILVFITFVKPKTEKEAEDLSHIIKNKWKLRIIGFVLFSIGIMWFSSNVEKDNKTASQESNKVSTEESNNQPSKSKYESMKPLENFDKAENKLLSFLNEAKIFVEITESPLADGTYRKMYQAKTSMVEVIGKPEVKQVSYMMVPSKSDTENLESILVLGGVLSTFCTNGNKSENGKFVKKFMEIFDKDDFNKMETKVGKCNAEISKGSKNLPVVFVILSVAD